MAAEKKTIVKPFRMSKAEAEHLRVQAKAMHLTESAYIRLLLSQKPNDYPQLRMLLKELINGVNAIGNNINQVTRNYNSGLYLEQDRELLLAYMKKLNLSMQEVVTLIGNQ